MRRGSIANSCFDGGCDELALLMEQLREHLVHQANGDRSVGIVSGRVGWRRGRLRFSVRHDEMQTLREGNETRRDETMRERERERDESENESENESEAKR